MDTCSECGKRFKRYQTPEERLLQAIYGDGPICKKCRMKKLGTQCTQCGEFVDYVTGFNDERLCKGCLERRFANA